MADLTGILFIGDVIGRPGRDAFTKLLPRLMKKYSPHFIVLNGENSASGFGITPEIYEEFVKTGVGAVTTGNHVFDRKEIIPAFDECERLLRPANYPKKSPGKGHGVFNASNGKRIGVVNLSGRVFMNDTLDCPFVAGEKLITELEKESDFIIVDFHGEATSEKCAFANIYDGRVSAVIGTHTHVQTSDERILPKGTAFITDAGMTGPVDSIIGVEKELVIKRFLTGMPVRFEVAEGDVELQGAFVKIDGSSSRAVAIERVKEKA